MVIRKIRKKATTASRVISNEGYAGLAIKTLQKFQKRRSTSAQLKKQIESMAKRADILAADWTSTSMPAAKPSVKDAYTVNWVVSPPGRGSGGHQNIFRFIRYLEQAGHTCRVYLYSTIDQRTVAEIKEVLKDSYPKTKTSIEWLDGEMKQADAIFATGWETAYPVFNSKLTAKRFYFVQDFEPYFYPVGSDSVLAENTYKFGFYGVTAGGWLAHKLRRDYGMETDHFDFGAEKAFYNHTNFKKRKEVFFYARPVTARRGFEMGVMALEVFHEKHPEITITLAGWDVSDYDLPFPCKNLKTLSLYELSDVYNKSAAALVMSLTNMSLMPLELLACGTIPVLNDGENNRLVSSNSYIEYAESNPTALANALSKVIEMPDQAAYAKMASASVGMNSWDDSGKKFAEIVEREIRNG